MVDEGARAARLERGQGPILQPTAGEKRMATAAQARLPAAAAAKRAAIAVPGGSTTTVSSGMEIELQEGGYEAQMKYQVGQPFHARNRE